MASEDAKFVKRDAEAAMVVESVSQDVMFIEKATEDAIDIMNAALHALTSVETFRYLTRGEKPSKWRTWSS